MQRITIYLLAALIVIVLTMQARFLYIFPAPDSARWWGDETGQMLELRAELQTGHARIPTALGSSLEGSNGLVRSNSWFAAIVYGVPALIFQNVTDVVSIGRTITFLLSLALCALMYAIMWRLRIDPPLALLTILLLISTRSFFYASHAARLDIAVGISLLLFVYHLSNRFEALKTENCKPTAMWCFQYGATTIAFATLSIHLLTLLGIFSIFVLFQFGIYRQIRLLLASIGGVISALAILIAIYVISGAPLTLFSASVKPDQFQSVASGLPILRPLSRSVQVANLLERLSGLWMEAPAVLIAAAITIIVIAFKRSGERSNASQFWTRGTFVIILAWLFLQSPALYYYAQIIPILLVCCAVVLYQRIRIPSYVVLFIGLALAAFGVRDSILAHSLAHRICADNNAAIDSSLRIIAGNDVTVLAQNPAIARVEFDKNVRLMTPHFLDFPVRNETAMQTMQRIDVRYIMLYAPGDRRTYSSDYATLRPLADSAATVRSRIPGILLDAHKDYFDLHALNEAPKDTLILYELAH